MLAIKFYNLQALIHRPFLSPSRLFRSCPDPMAIYRSERARIIRSKKKCVLAAQNTARLLHDVPDKQHLIYGFPWWQMISCLICASSILLVARLCMGDDSDEEVDGIDWLAVDEDADVCLTVFAELGSNSNAARLALKMMQGLKETRLHPQSQSRTLYVCDISTDLEIGTGRISLPSKDPPVVSDPRGIPLPHGPSAPAAVLPSTSAWYLPNGLSSSSHDPMLQEVPFDLSEPVLWSSQFVNAAYNPFFGQLDPDQVFEESWNIPHA